MKHVTLIVINTSTLESLRLKYIDKQRVTAARVRGSWKVSAACKSGDERLDPEYSVPFDSRRYQTTPDDLGSIYLFFDDFLDFFEGTLAPSLRASDNPIAIACFLLVTFFPDLPLLSVPFLRSCIAFSTFFDAFFAYFAINIPPEKLGSS